MKNALLAIASLVLIFGFMFVSSWYKDRQAEKSSFMAKENATTFVRKHSQTLGSDDAKVYIVEFMDPACETCAAFAPFIKQMMTANPGKIKLVLRYAPFHDGADYFVTILEAAKKQEKYWETLDAMFQSQSYWASHSNPQPQRVWEFLPQVGLDMERLKQDMKDPAITALIAQDVADAKTLNVRKTPGYFVNGKPLQEFGYQQLQDLVYSELREAYQK